MKKNNILRLVWIIGIYAILVVILYLVVTYKVKWEDKDLSTYLYFYNCSNDLCTSTQKPDVYYGSISCNYDLCPYIIEKNDDYIVLSNNKKQFLYNYIKDTIVSDEYSTYTVTSSKDYIVSDNNENYGVINREGEVLFNLAQIKITDYKDGYITYKSNNKYGIKNNEKGIDINPTYEKIILIDAYMYAYLEDENYFIASYDTELPIKNATYDYIYPIANIMLVFKNKQLNIIDNNLQSKLLMKIDTSYSYKIEKERASLNIYQKDNYIYFTIVNDDNKTTNYLYDIKNNKLFN